MGEPQEWVDQILKRFDFSSLEGLPPPAQESELPNVIAKPLPEDRVFLQKIVTEVWVYTDRDKKTFGTSNSQDIIVLGEMSRDEALKIIESKKGRRRKKPE